MSRIYSGAQHEGGFIPHRLVNWEVLPADGRKVDLTLGCSGTLKPRTGMTKFIVDERGHLLPGQKKASNAFSTSTLRPEERSPPRWPAATSITLRAAPNATMGYKGIQSAYLPRSTVVIKTIQTAGAREDKFA